MKLRARGPNGVSTVTLPDDSTVHDLESALSESCGLPLFDIKWGFPPRPLDLTQFDPSLPLRDTNLKLDGEQLILTARDIQGKLQHPIHNPPAPGKHDPLPGSRAASLIEPHTTSTGSSTSNNNNNNSSNNSNLLSLTRKPNNVESDPPEIPVPSHGATLVLRVMPDDNSCLFRAIGTAVLGDSIDTMTSLRHIVATGITSNPDLYSTAILQKPPAEYCAWIQDPDSWGGAIELGILAQHFDIEICSINVQDVRVDRFNEGRPTRCVLVYSGIHYDTIALSPSEPPHNKADLPPEMDQKVFDADDDEVLEAARALCRELQSRHYFTDTSGFAIKCNVCGWTGNGERAASEHAGETGHVDFGEAT